MMHGLAQQRPARLLVALILAASGVAATLSVLSANGSRADEVTASVNNLRDGWDPGETSGSLTPAALGSGLGELFAAPVNGQVYAQPVIAGGTVIVATENDWVYGLGAASGDVKWSSFLPAAVNPAAPGIPWPSSTEHCTDLGPNVGVTGTPVYDPAHGIVYLVSEEVPAGHRLSQPAYYLHALSAQAGAEEPGWPVLIHGAPVNDRSVPFNPFTQLQRPALLLLGGSVYAAFGSHCDFTPYAGYVVGVNVTKRTQTMWSDEAGVADTQAGIWQSGAGLMSDGPGRIFFASGNGISPPPGPGRTPPSQLAESVVRLAMRTDGSLAATDFFSPANAPQLDATDRDLGSGGPVGLPFRSAKYPHLLFQAGKSDGLFVLNRDSLGGRERGPRGTDAVVSKAGATLPGEWGHPAAFADTPVLSASNAGASQDYVYYLGNTDMLRYFRAGLSSGGAPVLTDVANSSDIFHYSSGSPVVTSNGANPATAVVWVVNVLGKTGGTGDLEAFPAVPPRPSSGSCSAKTPCTVSPLWTSAQFQSVAKFTIPATDHGRVYVGTRGVPSDGTNCPAVPSGDYCGQVLAFGTAPLGGPAPPSFGYVPVGSSSSAVPVTVQNTLSSGDVQVTSVSVPAGSPFAVGSSFQYTPKGQSAQPVTSFPVTLQPGDALTAEQVSFNPAVPGGASGALQFNTSSADFPVFGVSLSGFGQVNGFFASAKTVTFASVPAGTTAQQQVIVTNGDSVPQTLTASLPGAPFGVTGLPSPSTPIQPGQSIPLAITYQPTSASTDGPAALTLTGAGTVNPSVMLSGTGVPDRSALTAVPAKVSFGQVRLGRQGTGLIDVTNTGNLPAVITATASPPIPFGFPDQAGTGMPVNPGYDVKIPVTFTPTSIGLSSGDYQLTWTDVAGSHRLSVPVSGRGEATSAGIAVPPPGGGWTFNGSATMTGSSLRLTPATASQIGSAVYSVPVLSNGLKATFTARIGGGTGADGMTFALLAANTRQTAVGSAAGQLGFGGLPGVAVTLDTAKDGPGYPSANFVGLATSVRAGTLHFIATSTKVPALRKGTHVIGVSVSRGTITVTVDGHKVLARAIALGRSVRLAFTAATGGRTDQHVVSKVAITAGGSRVPGPGGGWSFNGRATTAGSDAVLTPARAPNEAGSVVYPTPVTTIGLRVSFDAQLGSTGGDGMTLALLNPATTSSRTIGAAGAFVGLGTRRGVPGLGVVLGTNGSPSPAGPQDFVGTTVKAGAGGLVFQRASAKGIGSLTTGTHVVTVTVTRGSLGPVLTIWLDGVQVLQRAEPSLTRTVRLAFTAGTAAALEPQLVRTVAVAAAG